MNKLIPNDFKFTFISIHFYKRSLECLIIKRHVVNLYKIYLIRSEMIFQHIPNKTELLHMRARFYEYARRRIDNTAALVSLLLVLSRAR